jgi:hemerythrin superfamily protein
VTADELHEAGLDADSHPDQSVLAVLREQHGRIRTLLDEVRAGSGAARSAAFDALSRTLAAHETAEEIVLRPVSVQLMSRDATADRNHEERRIAERLAELEQLDARDEPRWAELFATFEQAVVEHLSTEESREFPIVESEVDDLELARMARWTTRAFELGPDHAQPLTAGHPTAERVVMPFRVLADKMRDLLERTRDERLS